MRRDFAMPDVGEGLEEATVVEWLVTEGDDVLLNQPVCLIETAKAEVELPSPYAGRVATLRWSRGDTIHVGETLISFEVDGAADGAGAGPADGAATGDRQALLVGYGVEEDAARSASPRAWRRSAGPSETQLVPPSVSSQIAPQAAPAPVRAARPLATPPVRKLAKDLGVELSTLTGSGPDGQVSREDVRAAAGRVPGPPSRPIDGGPVPSVRPGAIVEMRGVRLRIAQRMATSRSTIPEATCGVWVDCSALLRLKDTLRASLDDPAVASTVTPFSILMRLVVVALEANPILNSSYDEPAGLIRVHTDVDLGVATSTARGLIVPVVRHAQLRRTLELAMEIGRLTAAAREGDLAPDQLSGSTFTVSNFGSLGLDDGIPVINHPEAAILGVGAIKERAVVVDGRVVARPTAKLVCSFDHRICDGAEAGSFLQMLRQLVEEPERALLHL